MTLQISAQAKEKMDIVGINEEYLKRAIDLGSIKKQAGCYLVSYAHLRMVYQKKGDLYRIGEISIKIGNENER